jgi:EAL domain-containing protein (putative c-di-GMP-specific phosphodiesterase class I)
VKIHRALVLGMGREAGSFEIVKALVGLAHNLGLEVIAEGVETPAQAAFLLGETCEEAQGYLYSKPLPAAEFELYLRNRPLLGADQRGDGPAGGKSGLQRRAPPARRAPGA